MKSNFLVFGSNRIALNPNYLAKYRSAAAVIAELFAELGEAGAYEQLFTDAAASLSPPASKLARARQLVANEFVSLQMALGGFKAFGGAENYFGYIDGPNTREQAEHETRFYIILHNINYAKFSMGVPNLCATRTNGMAAPRR